MSVCNTCDVEALRSRLQEVKTETAKIADLEEDIQELKDSTANDILAVTDRLDNLEESSNHPSHVASIDAIASEIQDRNARLNNLLVYGIPENPANDPLVDLQAVKNV
ncbi:hypothetical protein QAD02_003156 [Eretmocerus hayati]|uniref:Uncharacterized protein n=1 Tax=Eretmocerus hayati TaxID=131215 RepID=A0ACC2NLB9_9HYME|nr:hypothetical protein QAD02_003156 [Eretmocerus hayati]